MSDFLKQLKSRSQFFKKGHIIPVRILRCSKRKLQHLARFGSDTWAVPTESGYLCLVDMSLKDSCAIMLQRLPTGAKWLGSPYHTGSTDWLGDFERTPQQFEATVRSFLAQKNSQAPVPESN